VSSSSKLIAGTIVVAVVAAGGAAFAAMKLSDSADTYPRPALTAPYGGGVGSSSFGGGRLGGRGFGGGLGPGPSGFHGFFDATSSAVTAYLGLTAAALHADLQNGQTLAQVAKVQGKTAAGLVAAIVAVKKKRIDAAVSSGRLTQAQAQQFESRLQQQATDAVNGTRPQFGGFGGPGAPAPPAQTA
jgi:hypothetical protein